MTLDFIDELERLIAELAADDSVRALVFTGEGEENFSVGMNLKQLPEGMERMGGPEALFDQRLRVIAAIENLGKPSVATLFGYCLGGGLELPLGCHFRLAAQEGAQIGLPEMELGAVPAWGGSARLSKCVGRNQALDMILRGKKISGPEALRIGLVRELWPLAELKERAIALALELTEQPAGAVRSMLQVIVGSEDRSLEDVLAAERRRYWTIWARRMPPRALWRFWRSVSRSSTRAEVISSPALFLCCTEGVPYFLRSLMQRSFGGI